MSDRLFISVVIPTYNRAESTIAAIESVLEQTYINREVIIIDDGSVDGSGELIQRYIRQRAGRSDEILYFGQSNQGPSAARNAGVTRARGEYIAFLDSDDVWFPGKLECQVRAMEQFGGKCGACFTDTQLADRSGKDMTTFRAFGRHYHQTFGIEPDPLRSLAQAFCGFWVSTLLVRTDLIKQIEGFDPDVHYAEDRDVFFRLSLITSFAFVNKPLARIDRSVSPLGSACRPWENVETRLRGQKAMLEKWLRMGAALPPDVREMVGGNLRCVHSAWTNWYLENRRYSEARQAVSRAMKYEPTLGLTVKWVLTWLAPALVRRITPRSQAYL
jgi:cellulose synthase/poly-beta-1,6-N-acetylglucosamine synthase-like glycosyltransferase